MSDQFFHALPISQLPPEENEKIDEVFNANESQMFTDDDLKMWLSTIPDINMPVIYLYYVHGP
jgi:hypothetical protein